jgi:hypothetical protein
VRSLSPFGERVGVRGFEAYRETKTPHPTPLPMGEGADRVCGSASGPNYPPIVCARTGTDISPIGSIFATIVSPGFTGLTPSGVPVKSTSPGWNV